MVNCFSVDVEDYFQVSGFADQVRPEQWESYESRVTANTRRVLDLLERHGIHGTFFVLGWVAERFPQLVRDIHKAGHELGCHSHWHRLIYTMTPDDFRNDLRRSCRAISQVTGEEVTAYRAPSFSITAQSLWALEVLAEEGIRFDSSIFPIRHDRYGIPHAERFPHRLGTARGELCEFPPSARRWGRLNLPVGGGGYFRLYPGWLTVHWLEQINRRDGEPFMFYIHPWELDPDQPRLPGRMLSRWRHYVNLRTVVGKLETLFRRFRFAPQRDVLAALETDRGHPLAARSVDSLKVNFRR